jgi:ATP synthase subunit 6
MKKKNLCFEMIPDIFSSFDPSSYNTIIPSITIMFLINIIYIFIVDRNIWSLEANRSIISIPILQTIVPEVERTYIFNINPLNHLIHQIFFIVVILNIIGLFPYTFRITRHLLFTLRIGLPMWILLIMSRAVKSIKATIAHLLPEGAPNWLNPFLVLIESSRIIVRPITLSFRLAANIRAGHIVLGLIGIYAAASWFNRISTFIILLSLIIGYLLFEVAICLIQAYIFFLLLTLYANDHAH